jgi:hypothetical protein
MAKSKAKEKEKERDRDRAEGPKPKMDAYVMMLVITFLAIVTGCVLLYLDFQEYGSKTPPKEGVPTPAKLGEAGGKAAPAPAKSDPTDPPMDPPE